MKIVAFSERIWPEGGGGELATHLVLKLLAATDDFDVEVYTGTPSPAPVPSANVRVVGFLRAPNKIQLFANILANRGLVEKLIARADVVYVPRFSYPVIPIARRLGKRVIVHLHGYQPVSFTAVVLSAEADKPMSDFKRTLILEGVSGSLTRATVSAIATPLTKWIRRWVALADRVVCVSRRHEEVLLKLAPEYEGKTVVVYNPLPELPSTEKNLAEKPVLLYSGGESYVKGFHVLLKALKILGERGRRNFKLVLTNRYSRKSQKVVESLRKRYHFDIEVLGRISYDELILLHSYVWALLFPSIWEEPLPYAILESLFLGTIPISSGVGGAKEVVEGSPASDFLFTYNNEYEFADKIEQITMMDKQQICDLSFKLRQRILTRFNVEETTKILLKILHQE